MAKFEIVKVAAGKVQTVPGLPEFNSGKEAEHYAAQLRFSNPGVKFQPRPIADENNTLMREGMLPLVWEGVLRKISAEAVFDPKERVIRYFGTEEDRKFNRSQQMVLHQYLRLIFSDSFQYREEIEFWASQQDPCYFDDEVLHFAEDAEDIEFAYGNCGDQSCMSKSSKWYVQGEMPVRAYADGDLTIAYLTDAQRPGRVIARGIVWPERKIFGRLYGNILKLALFLKREGYRFGMGRDWYGARFATEWVSGEYVYEEGSEDYDDEWGSCADRYDEDEGWTAPYLDIVESLTLSEDRNYFIVDPDGEYSANNTSGTASHDYDHEFTCRECTRPHHRSSHDYLSFSGGGRICKVCAERKAGIDAIANEPFDDIDSGAVEAHILADGRKIKDEDRRAMHVCSVTGLKFLVRDLPTFNEKRMTPAEAEKEYYDRRNVLRNAFLPETLAFFDGREVHQEVSAAA